MLFYALALLAVYAVFACSEIDDNSMNSILSLEGKATTERIVVDGCIGD